MSAVQALGLIGAMTAITIAAATPVNLDKKGLPKEGGNGAPVCRTFFYNTALGSPRAK